MSLTVTRTTGVGCDTPQLYLSAPTAASDPALPLKTMKHFQKACDATTDVEFTVADADVSVWSTADAAFVVVPGVYGVSVGASSADIRLTGQLTV